MSTFLQGDILDDRELPENNVPPPSQVLSPVWIGKYISSVLTIVVGVQVGKGL